MTDEQFKAAKATMPWTEQTFQVAGSRAMMVRVVDRFGNEVPMFTMTAFLTLITAKLARDMMGATNG